MSEINHDRVERAFGLDSVGRTSTARAAHDTAVERGEDHGDHTTLAQRLVLESADGLRLASQLVAEQNAAASVWRHADELKVLSEAWAALASDRRPLD